MVPAISALGLRHPDREHARLAADADLANPMRYFLVIIKGVFLKDMPAAMVFGQIWPLAMIAAVTLSAATWLFRRRQ